MWRAGSSCLLPLVLGLDIFQQQPFPGNIVVSDQSGRAYYFLSLLKCGPALYVTAFRLGQAAFEDGQRGIWSFSHHVSFDQVGGNRKVTPIGYRLSGLWETGGCVTTRSPAALAPCWQAQQRPRVKFESSSQSLSWR